MAPVLEHSYTMKIHFLIVTVFVNFALCTPGYYWRDYDGDIPSDAVPGGMDRNGKTVYIGQMYLHKGDLKEGLMPTRVYRGSESMTASRYGIHTTSEFNKILCSSLPRESFAWLPATAQNLHLVAIGNHLVPGGTEDSALLYIGRVAYQSEVIVGKVTGHLGNARMFFPFNDQEQVVDSYEVLIFNGTNVPDIDVRANLMQVF